MADNATTTTTTFDPEEGGGGTRRGSPGGAPSPDAQGGDASSTRDPAAAADARSQPRDADLVRAAQQGDELAWNELVQRFAGLLYHIARSYGLDRQASNDVVQVSWLQLASRLDTLTTPGAVSSWLAAVARRASLAALREQGREIPVDTRALVDGTDLDGTPDDEIIPGDRSSRLWIALSRLPSRDRQLLRLLTATPRPDHAAVAAAMNLPVGSIGPTRARCLRRLRQELAGVGPGRYDIGTDGQAGRYGPHGR